MAFVKSFTIAAALLSLPVRGISLTVDNTDSIKAAASTIAHDLVSIYKGNQSGEIPGLLPSPDYYFWESAPFFDSLIRYYEFTGDSQYNALVDQGILFQQGQNSNFMPANQTKNEGSDDQAMWALTAMSAVEYNFPVTGNSTSWLDLAKNVFDDLAARWDTATCNGGLRWQIFSFNIGYDYKNSLSTGTFFQLAARLAKETGNSTYKDWANKAYSWSTESGLIDSQFNVYDGFHTEKNCSDFNRLQWSAVAGTYVTGAAYMYNVTSGDSAWKSKLDGLLSRTLSVFAGNGTLTEVACEGAGTCTTDQKPYKGISAAWLTNTIQVAPYTGSTIIPKLTSSAQAATKACNGGPSGTICAFKWNENQVEKDATAEAGQQINALNVVTGLLVHNAAVVGSNGTSTSGGSTGGNGTSSGSSTSSTPSPSATRTNGSNSRTSFTNMGALGAALALAAWIFL